MKRPLSVSGWFYVSMVIGVLGAFSFGMVVIAGLSSPDLDAPLLYALGTTTTAILVLITSVAVNMQKSRFRVFCAVTSALLCLLWSANYLFAAITLMIALWCMYNESTKTYFRARPFS